ncbi:Transcriptional regulatory protein SrrA [compost metagenome]
MYLNSSNYDNRIINNGKDVENAFMEYKPDLVLLDIMLPNVDGIDVLKWIRKESEVPVIMLTAKGDTFDKVLALELGADDYIVKPFEPKELLARVKAVMRRYNTDSTNKEIIDYSDLNVDANSYNVLYRGEEIKMPPKEFELLYYLASNKNKVFTREQLLCEVWGYDYPGDSRTVDVHIKRLREKLPEGINWQIETVWGVGYKFEVK